MKKKIIDLLEDFKLKEVKLLLRESNEYILLLSKIEQRLTSYLFEYLISNNNVDIITNIIDNGINTDIYDREKRHVVYNAIRLFYDDILKLLINNVQSNEILNTRDSYNNTLLYYSILHNNYNAFVLLLQKKSNIYEPNSKYHNIELIIKRKRIRMLKYLIDNKYNIDIYDKYNNNIIQICIYNNIETNIIKEIFAYAKSINIDNQNNTNGNTILHDCISNNKEELFNFIINNYNVSINTVNFLSNSILHEIINKYDMYLLNIVYNSKLINEYNFDIYNIDGNTVLHLILIKDIKISKNIISFFIEKSSLNTLNNKQQTPFFILYDKNLLNTYYDILIKKDINICIHDESFNKIIKDKKYYNLLVGSYYHNLKNKSNLEKWEIKCLEKYDNDCMQNIYKHLLSRDRCRIDNNIHIIKCKKESCMDKLYTGYDIEILSGVLYLLKKYSNILTSSILYDLCGDVFDFTWQNHKLYTHKNIDSNVKSMMLDNKIILFTLRILNSDDYHLNIIIWDNKKNIISRFEPNGSIYPIGLNYNKKLLDDNLKNFFLQYKKNITYYTPDDYLPPIGFQLLEYITNNDEVTFDNKCKYCVIWCIWWAFTLLKNINIIYPLYGFTNNLINEMKLNNIIFKQYIEGFSEKIISYRNKLLKNLDLDINSFIKTIIGDNCKKKITYFNIIKKFKSLNEI